MKYKKEITFDMDTNEMKKEFGVGNYTKPYRILKRVLQRDFNFEHRQGSVYCSFKVMSTLELCSILIKLKRKCPWLKKCLRRMDVCNVPLLHEVTRIMKL